MVLVAVVLAAVVLVVLAAVVLVLEVKAEPVGSLTHSKWSTVFLRIWTKIMTEN